MYIYETGSSGCLLVLTSFDSNLGRMQAFNGFHIPPTAAARNSLAGKMMGSPGKVKDQNLTAGASQGLPKLESYLNKLTGA